MIANDLEAVQNRGYWPMILLGRPVNPHFISLWNIHQSAWRIAGNWRPLHHRVYTTPEHYLKPMELWFIRLFHMVPILQGQVSNMASRNRHCNPDHDVIMLAEGFWWVFCSHILNAGTYSYLYKLLYHDFYHVSVCNYYLTISSSFF